MSTCIPIIEVHDFAEAPLGFEKIGLLLYFRGCFLLASNDFFYSLPFGSGLKKLLGMRVRATRLPKGVRVRPGTGGGGGGGCAARGQEPEGKRPER